MKTGLPIYHHVQTVAQSTWTINHNLGTKPTHDINVFDQGTQQKIYPRKVHHVNDNTLLIEFSSPRTGSARLTGVTTFTGQEISPLPTVSVVNQSSAGGSNLMSITITRSDNLGNSSVDWAVQGNSFPNGVYDNNSNLAVGTATFVNGQDTYTFQAELVGISRPYTFTLTLYNPIGCTVGDGIAQITFAA